ncbi:MAG TPA: hypothetical protein VIX60_03865 [Candidatus Cybelea sp.]
MSKTLAIAATTLALSCALATLACAEQFVPPRPGSVVASRHVDFTGTGASGQWRAVVSKKLLGSDKGRNFYQWYLSIYALRRGAYRLRYQSPGNGGPLSRVTRANGVKLWFPTQEIDIVGAAALMHRGTQELVVASHETGADCGGATVTVLGAKPGDSVGPVLAVENPCDLNAKIAADGLSIELSGPYYSSNAPLCCPTNPNATATLRYREGKWVESPSYFKIE